MSDDYADLIERASRDLRIKACPRCSAPLWFRVLMGALYLLAFLAVYEWTAPLVAWITGAEGAGR